MFLHRLAHSFNGYVFRVTLTVTVFPLKAFYCIVLEKTKSKITQNIKMRPTTWIISVYSNTHKKFLHRLAYSLNGYVYSVTLTITIFIFNSFYCIVLEKNKSKIPTYARSHLLGYLLWFHLRFLPLNSYHILMLIVLLTLSVPL